MSYQIIRKFEYQVRVRTSSTAAESILLVGYGIGRRPRWLGRLSSYLLKSFLEFNSHRVHIHVGTFSCIKQWISGKRESVSGQHSMKIDEQWEC